MTEASPDRIRRKIVAWNIFLDARVPQEDRLDDIVATLEAQGDFDIVGLLEVQKKNGHNGEKIAQKLAQTAGLWYAHSRKTMGEHIGVFGPDVEVAKPIDLGYKKTAVLVELGDVAVVLYHLRRQHKHFPRQPEQIHQTSRLLEAVEGYSKAVLIGDTNSLSFQKPRRMLKAAGFRSAYVELNKKRPPFPTENFREVLSLQQQLGLALVGGSISIDDVYTRGMSDSLVSVDWFIGESDHTGMVLEYDE